MASERQRQANRRNGRKGGPNTETGKQRSRQNSLTHGLSASTLVVMSEEDPHEYEEVLRGFRESFQPHDPVEDALVLRLAHAHWRSLRSRRVETGILNITAATERALAKKIVEDAPEHLNPHNAIAVGFMKNPAERWQMYLRYDTTISRDFFRTLDALTRLQRARQPRNPPPKPLAVAAGTQFAQHAVQHQYIGTPDLQETPEPTNADGPPPSSVTVSDSGIRSVLQNGALLPDLNQPKELTRESKDESKEQKNDELRRSRRTLRSARPVAHSTQDTPHRVSRKSKPTPKRRRRPMLARRTIERERLIDFPRSLVHTQHSGGI